MKKTAIEIALLFVIVGILVLAGCMDDGNIDIGGDVYSTKVEREGVAVYGKYIYLDKMSMCRYDMKKNIMSPACTDPECSGDCPLDCVMTYIIGVYDGRLYFSAFQAYTHYLFYAYQELATGKVIVVDTLDFAESDGGAQGNYYNGYLYYPKMILRDGGDASKPEDYDKCIVETEVNGGEGRTVYTCGAGEGLMSVCGGYMIFTCGDGMFSIDLKTNEKKTLCDLLPSSVIVYLDGKIYFMSYSGDCATSEYSRMQYGAYRLKCIDLATGVVREPVSVPIVSFSLTDDAIYYAPFELRHTYIPDDYKEHPEDVRVMTASPTLHRCALDGSGDEEIYTNENWMYSDTFIVVNNKLYGWMSDLNHGQQKNEIKLSWGYIDMKTGGDPILTQMDERLLERINKMR